MKLYNVYLKICYENNALMASCTSLPEAIKCAGEVVNKRKIDLKQGENLIISEDIANTPITELNPVWDYSEEIATAIRNIFSDTRIRSIPS